MKHCLVEVGLAFRADVSKMRLNRIELAEIPLKTDIEQP